MLMLLLYVQHSLNILKKFPRSFSDVCDFWTYHNLHKKAVTLSQSLETHTFCIDQYELNEYTYLDLSLSPKKKPQFIRKY